MPPNIADPDFEVLPIPTGAAPIGHSMNMLAIRRLVVAHAAGRSHDELADLYDRLKVQIESADPGWTASRGMCADGSHVFCGSQGRVLVVTPARLVLVGNLGAGGPDALVSYLGLRRGPSGNMVFPPPNLAASHIKKVAG